MTAARPRRSRLRPWRRAARRRGPVRGQAIAVLVIAVLVGCGRAEKSKISPLQGRAEATATLDRKGLAFGDDFTLTVEARSDPALEVELPHLAELPGFRVLDSGTSRSESGGVLVERRWHRLRAERAGAQTLPALDVRYRPAAAAGSKPAAAEVGWKTVSTAPIEVEVRSLLPPAGDQPPQIREIKPLQPIRRALPWWWVAAGIAVVIALAAAFAYWLRRRRATVEAVPKAPPIPPHQLALEALDRLAASDPVGDAAVRRFHFALSEIVRAYIEGRFGLNATDLTAEEILLSLDRLDLLEEHAVGLRAFLHDTDRVKFAAHRPQRAEIAAILDWSRRFVLETRPPDHEDGSGETAEREAA